MVEDSTTGARETDEDPLVVMHAVRKGATVPSYIQQIIDHSPTYVVHKTLSVRDVLLQNYDVFHIHWPEIMIRGKSRLQTWVRKLAFLVMLSILYLRKTPVVRTIHNVKPHESTTRLERLLLSLLDKRTSTYVVLNHATPTPGTKESAYIPHPHYKASYTAPSSSMPKPGRLLFFGFIRPYKGVETLINAFKATSDPSLSLHVLGRPYDSHIESTIKSLALGDERIYCRLDYIPEEDVIEAFGQAELVVLPYQDADSNSGVTLLALSLNRPVLARASLVNEQLAEEVGRQWLIQFEGELDAASLSNAAHIASTLLSSPNHQQANLDARDPRRVSAQYASVYAKALKANSTS